MTYTGLADKIKVVLGRMEKWGGRVKVDKEDAYFR